MVLRENNGSEKLQKPKGTGTPRRFDPALIAAGIAVLAAIVGGGLLFWVETQKGGAVVEGRLPWMQKWLDSREKHTDSNTRRIERLESQQMEK